MLILAVCVDVRVKKNNSNKIMQIGFDLALSVMFNVTAYTFVLTRFNACRTMGNFTSAALNRFHKNMHWS